jgi:hypothetical protein
MLRRARRGDAEADVDEARAAQPAVKRRRRCRRAQKEG